MLPLDVVQAMCDESISNQNKCPICGTNLRSKFYDSPLTTTKTRKTGFNLYATEMFAKIPPSEHHNFSVLRKRWSRLDTVSKRSYEEKARQIMHLRNARETKKGANKEKSAKTMYNRLKQRLNCWFFPRSIRQ
jgi:5-methylcytosine-specific restriction endonuclease McrBC regulatory subunit McrC